MERHAGVSARKVAVRGMFQTHQSRRPLPEQFLNRRMDALPDQPAVDVTAPEHDVCALGGLERGIFRISFDQDGRRLPDVTVIHAANVTRRLPARGMSLRAVWRFTSDATGALRCHLIRDNETCTFP